MKKKLLLQNQIKVLIKTYIKLLNLTEWDLDVVVSEKDLLKVKRGKVKITKPDFFAECVYDYLTKSATIVITKKEELEDTIIHELLHIKLAHLIQLTESIVNASDFSKDRKLQLLKQIDEQEHLIIQTIIKLILEKKNGK